MVDQTPMDSEAVVADTGAFTEIDAAFAQQVTDSDTLAADIAVTVKADIEKLEKSVAAGLAEIARLTALIPVVVPPVVPPVTVSKLVVGAGGGNSDRTKAPIKVDRRYYGAGDVAKAVTNVKANAAAGILTWASFKLGYSWADMVAGKGDVWAKDLIAKLVALKTPVWIAFHHEPEGDGVMTDWTKMQDRLSRFVPVGGDVKYWLIVTGWHQSKGTTVANKWPALYPKGAPIWGIAYDYPYQSYGKVTKDGVVTNNTAWTDPNFYVDHVADTCASISVSEKRTGANVLKAGIAEWGYGDEAFAKDKTWLVKVLQRCKDRGLVGNAYFDTTLNSSHTWTLGTATSAKRIYVEGQFKAFNGI